MAVSFVELFLSNTINMDVQVECYLNNEFSVSWVVNVIFPLIVIVDSHTYNDSKGDNNDSYEQCPLVHKEVFDETFHGVMF